MNDAGIIGVLSAFFIILGFILPFIQADLGDNSVSADLSEVTDGMDGDDAKSTIGAFRVIGSIISMFFWTFGGLPVLIDVILIVPRIVLGFVVARNIWVGGGG